MSILYVALGGGLGAISRYLLGVLIKERTKQRNIPTAMLYVNVLGSFGLGLFFGWIFQEVPQMAYEDPFYLLLGIGFFGAFTTFSTFSVEASSLLEKRKYKELVSYVGLSIGGSILAFTVGMMIGGLLAGSPKL